MYMRNSRLLDVLGTAPGMAGDIHAEHQIAAQTVANYVDAASNAYIQAGLDPQTAGEFAPGISAMGNIFQVSLTESPLGIIGARHVIANTNRSRVDEVDLYLSGNAVDASEGKLVVPDQYNIKDYRITEHRVRAVTNFMLQAYDRHQFTPQVHASAVPVLQ